MRGTFFISSQSETGTSNAVVSGPRLSILNYFDNIGGERRRGREVICHAGCGGIKATF